MHHRPSAPPRRMTFPGSHTWRQKPRRWPLVLRVSRGSVHMEIIVPVLLHSIFTCLIVFLDQHWHRLGLPGTIVPSLSIVVGLMLVFRNGTSYDRFWTGRNCLASMIAGVRSLTRYFLVYSQDLKSDTSSEEEDRDTESTIRVMIAMLYAVKHTLRAEFAGSGAGVEPSLPATVAVGSSTGTLTPSVAMTGSLGNLNAVFSNLLPSALPSLEDKGVALPVQLSLSLEGYIRRGVQRAWWAAPQAGMLSATVNSLLTDFAKMETIRQTPVPVVYLIHARQVLALYMMVVPFALVDEMSWWSVPVVALLSFTLYGIETIGRQLEDPFGYDKNDIKMDAIILDAHDEIEGLLHEWNSKRPGFH